MMEEEVKQFDRDARAKQIYISPRLVVHGNIEEITQGEEGGEQEGELSGGNSIGGQA